MARADAQAQQLPFELGEISPGDGVIDQAGINHGETMKTMTPLFVYFVQLRLVSKTPLSLILFDIDFFKRINDGHGHPAGDAILRDVTRVATTAIADQGLLARVGGEEFAVLVAAPLAQARATGERVRAAVERHVFTFENRPIAVTVSVGVAELQPHESPTKLYERGDALLYASKHNGRNSVSG